MRKIKEGQLVLNSDWRNLEKIYALNDLKIGDIVALGNCISPTYRIIVNPEASVFEHAINKGILYRVSRPDEKAEPLVGDEIQLKDCKVGWTYEGREGARRIIEGHVVGKGFNVKSLSSTDSCSFHYYSELYTKIKVKLISKGSPQPGDIVELRNCQAGWTFEYLDNIHLNNLIGEHRTILEKDYEKEKVRFQEGCMGFGRKVKLISKGDEAGQACSMSHLGSVNKTIEEEFAGKKNIFAAIVDRHLQQKPAQQPMSTQEFQEHMGRPGEVVEEKTIEKMPSIGQGFTIPKSLMDKMIENINGLPPDTEYVFNGMNICLRSIEFRDFPEDRKSPEYIHIIPDGDGWKVEGT